MDAVGDSCFGDWEVGDWEEASCEGLFWSSERADWEVMS